MIIIAGCLYLPEHITTMCSRAWFYYAGPDEPGADAGMAGKMPVGGARVISGTGPMAGPARAEGQQVLEHLGNL